MELVFFYYILGVLNFYKMYHLFVLIVLYLEYPPRFYLLLACLRSVVD